MHVLGTTLMMSEESVHNQTFCRHAIRCAQRQYLLTHSPQLEEGLTTDKWSQLQEVPTELSGPVPRGRFTPKIGQRGVALDRSAVRSIGRPQWETYLHKEQLKAAQMWLHSIASASVVTTGNHSSVDQCVENCLGLMNKAYASLLCVKLREAPNVEEKLRVTLLGYSQTRLAQLLQCMQMHLWEFIGPSV